MLLTVTDITKSFGTTRVLGGVSFDLAAGRSLALTGESGSGKSTLLHIVAGLEAADSGEVRVDGAVIPNNDKALAAYRRDVVGVIFQQFNLIPSLSVADNLSFQARLSGRVDASWIADLTGRLGLGDLGQRYPEQLSGGQQQRVAIGRALAARPKLLLADEPTGNLDENTADAVMELMVDLTRDAGAGLLMVTHSDTRAAALDAQIRLSHGQLI
ncbi:MAG: ABC transporter ATP-binding protein [Pseudomonadota bacterium]